MVGAGLVTKSYPACNLMDCSPLDSTVDAWRYCGQEEKGTTEDEMAGWHHRLDGCEFE